MKRIALAQQQATLERAVRRLTTENDQLREALLCLKRDVEDYGSPRRHQQALLRADRVLGGDE